MTLQQLKEETKKEVDDYYKINPKYRTKDKLKDFINCIITKVYKETQNEMLSKISKIPKLEMTFSDIQQAL